MRRERGRFWLWAGAALLAGLLLRLWFIRHLSRVAGDSLVYGDIAKNLLLHGVYGFAERGRVAGSIEIRPTLIRLPGYPLFLAACFRVFGIEHYRAVLYVQAVADLVTCWLAAALARLVFGVRAFLPVLWLAALCPFTANYVAAPLTETLVLTSIAAAFYCFARWQRAGARYNVWLWGIACALAYSILLRPDQGLLAAAVVPAMLWEAWASCSKVERRAHPLRCFAPVVVGGLCVLLPFAPWTLRNWRTFHVFQPLAPRSASDPGELQLEGFNRWYRTWAIEFASTEEVYWDYDGNRVELGYIPTRAFGLGCTTPRGATRESLPLYVQTAALLSAYNQDTTATPAVDAGFGQLAEQRIRAAPVCYYLLLPIARVLNMMFRPRIEMMPLQDEWWKRPAKRGQIVFAGAYGALNLGYFLLAFAGLWVWRRRGWLGFRALAWAMAASVILRAGLLLTLDNSEARYTLEFFPVLLVWAGGVFASRVEMQG